MGPQFDLRVLKAASARSKEAVQSDLERLLRSELVQRLHRREPHVFAFRHGLIREAAYDTLPKGAREQAHRQISETLEAHFAGILSTQPGDAARHYASVASSKLCVNAGQTRVLR